MSDSDTSTQRTSSAVLRYGVAIASIAVALILTLLVGPDALQSPIILAIILTAGIVFLLSALLISSWSAARRRAEQALRRARDELEVKVQERTGELGRSNEQLQKAFQETRALRDQFRLFIDTIPVMVWSAFPDGSLDFFNQRWVEYHGCSMEDLDPQGWQAVIHPEDRARADDKWRAGLAAGEPYEHELRVRRADGEYRWFLVRAVPLRDEHGKHRQMVWNGHRYSGPKAGGRKAAAERGLPGGSAAADPNRQLGTEHRHRRTHPLIGGTIPFVWLRSGKGRTVIRRISPEGSSAGSSQDTSRRSTEHSVNGRTTRWITEPFFRTARSSTFMRQGIPFSTQPAISLNTSGSAWR